jgi:ectoine hydroxylase
LTEKYGIVAPKGPAGSVLFFHGNIVHGSAANMSPFARNLVLVTFNHIDNIPVPMRQGHKLQPRPEFLVSRDTTPVELLADTVLLS